MRGLSVWVPRKGKLCQTRSLLPSYKSSVIPELNLEKQFYVPRVCLWISFGWGLIGPCWMQSYGINLWFGVSKLHTGWASKSGHTSHCGPFYFSFLDSFRDGWRHQNGWIFGKVPNGICPPPLIFGKSYCGFRDKSAYVHYGGTVVYYVILFPMRCL